MSHEVKDSKGTLPPEGTLLRANDWRRQTLWIVCACVGLLTALAAVSALSRGNAAGLLGVAGYGLFTIILARAAMAGILVESEGIKARKALRTSRWRWDEIEKLELREPGERLRLRVHLCNGTIHKLSGFFAWSKKEEAKSQALFRALEERLEDEKAKPLARGSIHGGASSAD